MRVAIALRGCAQKDLAAAMGITPASLSQKFVDEDLVEPRRYRKSLRFLQCET